MPEEPITEPRARQARRRSPFLAALLSAIVPGIGHLYLGRRRRGWVFVGITTALVVPAALLLAVVVFGSGLDLALAVSRPFFSSPNLLILLLVLNAALLGFRAFAVADAFLTAGPGEGRLATRSILVAGLGVLLIATAVPHLYVGERNLLLHDLLTHDFVSDPNQTATTSTSTTSLPPAGGSAPSSTAPPTTTTSTLPAAFPEEGRVNILLLGGDSGVDRRGIRTDTMIVLSIDPATGWTAMFGIPRNLFGLPIPGGHPAQGAWDNCPDCFGMIANELYAWGLKRPDLFGEPNSGANATKSLVGYLLDIDIHYFALVDLEGFVEIIDAIGGVDIVVTERVYDSAYPNEDGSISVVDLTPGTYHMDGHLALYYARSRQGSHDFSRMNRQRCVLEALAEQADPVSLLRQFPTIVPAIESSVLTDLPMAAIPDFIELVAKVNTQEIVSIRFMPDAPEFAGTSTSYIGGWTADRYPIPDRDFIAQTVATALSLPPLEAMEALNLQPLDDLCGDTQTADAQP
ncbi:MAG: LCP family protein [Actinomycetota bacterium]